MGENALISALLLVGSLVSVSVSLLPVVKASVVAALPSNVLAVVV